MSIAKFTKTEDQFTNLPQGGMGKFGTPKRRKEAPATDFLMPKQRKFPYKVNGKIDKRLLIAAIHRAGQYGYKGVELRAQRILQEFEKKNPKQVFIISNKAIK